MSKSVQTPTPNRRARRQLLLGTRMSIGQIAATLGYADASGFTHAFRRWSGTSPAAWRVAAELYQ